MNPFAIFALLGALAHDAGNAIDRYAAAQPVPDRRGAVTEPVAPGAPVTPGKRDEGR